MRIMLVTKKYVPAAGGAERSAHALLLTAAEMGHQVEAVVQTHQKYAGPGSGVVRVGPVSVRQIQDEDEVREAIMLDKVPDMIFTQIDWNRTAVRIAREQGIPVVHFSRVGDLNPEADFQVFNSSFVRGTWLPTYPDLESCSVILHPTIRRDELGPFQPGGPAVLAVNPVRAKGGLMLRAIAKAMPDTPFVGTLGWCDPLSDGVDLGSLPNVRLVTPEDGIARLAAGCFALAMPALWDEPFGRVIVEAMGLGLPVVAIRRGGIPEAMGRVGVLVEPDAGVDAWVTALRALQSRGECYRREQEAGLDRAARYVTECDPVPLLRRLQVLRREYRGPRPVIGPPAPYVNGEWFLNLNERV